MILMLNTSLKNKSSNTSYFLNVLEKELQGKECKTIDIRTVLKNDIQLFVEELQRSEALVIGAPLYVDGLPAQAVRLLEVLLENYKGSFPGLPVYVVSNLGFYEGKQIRHLFDMVRNWCLRMDVCYGGGLAIGAGPMVSILRNMPLKSGLNKDVGHGFEALATAIVGGNTMKNYYAQTAIPRFVYLFAAHRNFKKDLKNI